MQARGNLQKRARQSSLRTTRHTVSDVPELMRPSAELTRRFLPQRKIQGGNGVDAEPHAAQMFIHGRGRSAVRANETADDPQTILIPLVTS